MENKALHIVNGDGLSEQVQDLDLPGEIVVWRELLCEGPSLQKIDDEFISLRKKFLKDTYDISSENYEERFVTSVNKLKEIEDYDHVILWFEFDLFCHINMLAALNLLNDFKEPRPVYLVCSKKLKGEKSLNPLSQLTQEQLLNHYENKIPLNSDDLEVANLIWELYCCNDPIKLKHQIKTPTSFEYLSSCIRAHIERFPNSVNGINSLEKNVLKLIESHQIKSEHHLLGYSLEYQGYYGYSDNQMRRLLNRLQIFYELGDDKIVLTDKGIMALQGKKNFYRELKNEDYFGGAKMYDFLYDSENHRLLKL